MLLTDRSQGALRLARSESEAMGHDHLGTRHLLLGLLLENGVAASVLTSLGFEPEEVKERVRTVRSAPEEPNPGSTGDKPISRPAVIALAYGQQEALILGADLADTEHVLLGLIRLAQSSHPACDFARIVGFYDRMRIRNEVLRLVARHPGSTEVARRTPMACAAPSEFESYAVNLLCDALTRMPPAAAAAITHMTMQFGLEPDDPTQPVIEVRWNTAVNGETAQSLDGYAVRIPPIGADAQQGGAVTTLAHRLNRLLHDADALWDTVGHSIAALFPPASHHDAHPNADT
jgi:Clp amino terminal domain, pathogenicity island component